ncbi:MAG: cysteine--tRNA ligase [Candidatus Xenobia bacterium]
MSIRFFNTMTRQLEEFKPIREGEARLYTCGPTVYDYAHIGNFRAYAFEDLLRRYLKYRGYKVTQVMNITDVEDKIIRKVRESGLDRADVVGPYIQAFHEDLKTLNIEPAEHYPRATEYIAQMIEIIQKLLDKGVAYRSEDGSIYYSIEKFPSYGKLAHINLEELKVGVRKPTDEDEYEKENASDFALWKAYDPADATVVWDSPFGRGRPGWHIECSAMSMQLLGEHFDIHTGGEDNIFPHHENEIAQSEAYSGQKFVNYWMHCKHLLVENTKMSKSKGNFFTLRDLQKKGFSPLAVRYVYISSQYNRGLNFTLADLEAKERTIKGLYDFLERLRDWKAEGAVHAEVEALLKRTRDDFIAAMDEDLNTPEALEALFVLKSEINRRMDANTLSTPDARQVIDLYLELDAVLGLHMAEAAKPKVLAEEIEARIQEREAARKARDWKTADRIRDELKARGIILEDTPAGVRWKAESLT